MSALSCYQTMLYVCVCVFVCMCEENLENLLKKHDVLSFFFVFDGEQNSVSRFRQQTFPLHPKPICGKWGSDN
jgi:hypothetical protein